MFLLKKVVSGSLMPLPLCLEMICVGIVLLWFTRKQKAGKILVSIGTILLTLLGNAVVSSTLLRPLENRYPSVDTAPKGRPEVPTVKYIVVLGGAFTTDPDIPVASQLGESTLARLVEGVRLYQELPGRKLILSGGPLLGKTTESEAMSKAAQELGVAPQDIQLESNSLDTEDEARFVRPLVGNQQFFLVTSAAHMPRSMALFLKQGMNPIPAPTDHMAWGAYPLRPDSFYPTPLGLEIATRWVHENLGMIWEVLRNKA